ncbi:trypsin-like serine protease [Mangrovicoccus ximenensis]|uniref:trypsin-like serine protease n=1 Tax=Mangrovicoccus ximenensis TaxID=1911570 RepID=UPI000D3D4D8C|nr:trypsin-like serine protease [Mangrovicoccus ximenensis]
MRLLPALAALMLCLAAPAGAVTVKDSFGGSATPLALSASLGAHADFDAVARLRLSGGGICSGALISPTAVLTARHCADAGGASSWSAEFRSGGATTGTGVASIAALAPDPADPGDYFNGTDLAVFRLSSPVTGIDPLLVLGDDPLTESFAMVGWGRYGTGSSGATLGPGTGRRGFALNMLEGYTRDSADALALLLADFDREDGSGNTLLTALDPPLASDAAPLGYEGLIAPGDSGGPMLVLREGKWVVAGVVTGILGYDGSADSDYGDVGVWTALGSSAARGLVGDAGGNYYAATVPLPFPVAMLGAACAGLVLLGRRSQP